MAAPSFETLLKNIFYASKWSKKSPEDTPNLDWIPHNPQNRSEKPLNPSKKRTKKGENQKENKKGKRKRNAKYEMKYLQ